MCDFEYLLCMEIHKKLKNKIIGSVWVKIHHNELHIVIKNDDVKYEFVTGDFAQQVMNGLSSDDIVNVVIPYYRRHVMSIYFR